MITPDSKVKKEDERRDELALKVLRTPPKPHKGTKASKKKQKPRNG